jgi:hypothetical protein
VLPPYAQSSDFYAIHNTTIGLGEQRMFSARMGKETDKTGYDFHSGVRGRIAGVASADEKSGDVSLAQRLVKEALLR